MRGCGLSALGGFALVTFVLAFGSGAVSAPPDLSITSTGSLTSQEVEQVRSRLKYWADEIVAGTGAAQVVSAAASARNDYERYTTRDYRYRFAEVADEVLTPVLKGGIKQDDKFRLIKEVNLAIILARIDQISIMPALSSMLDHENPAVRYLGWEGYRLGSPQILAQSRQYAQGMLDALTAAARKETSAPVIGAAFLTANISLLSQVAPASTIKEAQQRMFKMLDDNWLKWCRRVLSGEAEMSRACVKSILPIRTLSGAQAAGDKSKTEALQMLADLMQSAAGAYDFSAGEGPIASENTELLRVCEKAIVELSGLTSNRVVAILTDEKFEGDRGAMVGSKVYEWFDELKQFGVVEPRVAPAEDKPAPETEPGAATP